MSEKMHAPRLQLRWALATEEEAESHTPASLRAVFKSRIWTCHYELVIQLRKGDVRYGESGYNNPDLFIVSLGSTTASSTLRSEPSFPPYRDGHHAQWDAAQLGHLPVYHVASDGSFKLQETPE